MGFVRLTAELHQMNWVGDTPTAAIPPKINLLHNYYTLIPGNLFLTRMSSRSSFFDSFDPFIIQGYKKPLKLISVPLRAEIYQMVPYLFGWMFVFIAYQTNILYSPENFGRKERLQEDAFGIFPPGVGKKPILFIFADK